MKKVILTSSFKRSFRKFVRRNPKRKIQIQDTIRDMQIDVFASHLGTHKFRSHGI
jgi:mRNA interferase YafQ